MQTFWMPPLERILITPIVPGPLILLLDVPFYAKHADNKGHHNFIRHAYEAQEGFLMGEIICNLSPYLVKFQNLCKRFSIHLPHWYTFLHIWSQQRDAINLVGSVQNSLSTIQHHFPLFCTHNTSFSQFRFILHWWHVLPELPFSEMRNYTVEWVF